MKNTVNQYVKKFTHARQVRRRFLSIVLILALVVSLCVFWQLRSDGVAMANETFCGMEEHTHGEECYEQVLTCGLEESDEPDGHTHTDACYKSVLTCDIPEHIHTVDCLIDETADVEEAADWEATLPDDLTDNWADNVVAIAESQIGYTESEANFRLAEDNATRQGYTRYGAWYGNEYGDWDAMFASFCLSYAGVPESEFPQADGCWAWTIDLDAMGLYKDAATSAYTPQPGDLIFFTESNENEASVDHVGIVEQVQADTDEETLEQIWVIEGDRDDMVQSVLYDFTSDNPGDIDAVATIAGYGSLPEQPGAAGLYDTDDVYTIDYISEMPEVMEIEGPDTAEEGEDLYFSVTVADGYVLSEVTANGEELEAGETFVYEDKTEYTYELEDVSEDTTVFLDATQVLKGSGEAEVYERNSTSEKAEYTLKVTDAPTNTKISLDSPTVTLVDEYGNVVGDITLDGNLYYVTDETKVIENGSPVAYLMLDGDIAGEDSFVLTAYSETGEAFSGGCLVLNVSNGVGDVEIWKIQTNTLCSLDESGTYQQEIVDAVSAFEATVYHTDAANGETVNLAELTGTEGKGYKFYYGSIDGNAFSLTLCTTGQMVDGKLLPLDSNGQPVSGVNLYMAYDEVYSFDVEVTSVVNEHTEDNGDTYLWLGDTFAVDQYHNQGYDEIGYTRSQNTLANCGVWVQLGRMREEAINGKTKTFSDYANVTYQGMLAEGVSLTGYDSANAASTAEANAPYGIVGPEQFENGESEPETTTVRVTGHKGDYFTSTEVFGSGMVYMEETDTELEEQWINLGSHASDNGYRAWFYWINDYYIENNYHDVVEYLQIADDTETDQVRMYVDVIGTSTDETEGQTEYDLWNTNLYSKRDSEIKQWMLNHSEELTEQGVGFSSHVGGLNHLQLRVSTTVETVVNEVIYSGELSVFYGDYGEDENGDAVTYPYLTGSVNCKDTDGNPLVESDIKYVFSRSNDQETNSYYFGADENTSSRYICAEDAFDSDKVQLTVYVAVTGTLTGTDGSTIVYTADNPLIYSATLTDEMLKEAYDCCPNSEGYDVAINFNDAVKIDAEKEIILYKIWEDESNRLGARDNVSAVTVSLQRSKDKVTWEDVVDEEGDKRAFTIRGTADSDIWSLTLDSSDLDLTYEDEYGIEQDYYFRISGEQDINGVKDGYYYTYDLDDEDLLTITNTLAEYPISITGVKEWVDEAGNPLSESTLPDSVIIGLYQNDQFYDMAEVTKENDWRFSFENLPQTIDDDYVYTLYELAEDGTIVGSDDTILLDGYYYKVKITAAGGDGEDPDDSDVDYTITNEIIPTPELPKTGGAGVIPFAIAGISIVGASGYLLYRNRRRKRKTVA